MVFLSRHAKNATSINVLYKLIRDFEGAFLLKVLKNTVSKAKLNVTKQIQINSTKVFLSSLL